ncbi:MAG: methyltransferase domain-containing protein [Candidatus Omnitrophica bacterium]|nr:methyltransferase domain-containing protein [Candidatus Omnitrophota bacterium]
MDLIDRECAVCRQDDHVEVFDQPTGAIIGIGDIGYHHRIQLCRRCGFVFAAPVLTEKMIFSFYEKMSNYEQPQHRGQRPQPEIDQIHRYVQLISRRFPEGFRGKALDIGCATAYGLSLFKARGWDVLGLDPSARCVALSKQCYDVRVIQGFFDPAVLIPEKPFDLIVLCHVLEHLLHPDKMLDDLNGLLSENGRVYIEVPDLMKPYAQKCYFGFEHVNFFTPVTLTNLARAHGFAVDSLSTFDNGPQISPFYPVIGVTLSKSGKKSALNNDYADVLPVIEKFKSGSMRLMARLQALISGIIEQTPKGRLALWGAGIHTSQLLSETALGQTPLACIFDNDPKKRGSFLQGHPVESFTGNIEDVKKRIDAILISSEASENDIYQQIGHLEGHGIRIYRLYQEEKNNDNMEKCS